MLLLGSIALLLSLISKWRSRFSLIDQKREAEDLGWHLRPLSRLGNKLKAARVPELALTGPPPTQSEPFTFQPRLQEVRAPGWRPSPHTVHLAQSLRVGSTRKSTSKTLMGTAGRREPQAAEKQTWKSQQQSSRQEASSQECVCPSGPHEQPLLSWTQSRAVTCQALATGRLTTADRLSPVLVVWGDVLFFSGGIGLGPQVLNTESILARARPLQGIRETPCAGDRAEQMLFIMVFRPQTLGL